MPEVRVVVLEPEASSSEVGDDIDITAFAILEASLGTLATLEGIDAVKPSKVSKGLLAPEEAAKEVAADEVLGIRVECRPKWCLVSFRRLRGSDGATLRVGVPFEVPRRPEDVLDLTHAVGGHLRPGLISRLPRAIVPPKRGASRRGPPAVRGWHGSCIFDRTAVNLVGRAMFKARP